MALGWLDLELKAAGSVGPLVNSSQLLLGLFLHSQNSTEAAQHALLECMQIIHALPHQLVLAHEVLVVVPGDLGGFLPVF